jgi:hypothetical protein
MSQQNENANKVSSLKKPKNKDYEGYS